MGKILYSLVRCDIMEKIKRRGVLQMNTNIMKRGLSWLFTLLLVMGMVVTAAPMETSAATDTITVKIANVSRRYSEASIFLDKINAYRKENGKSALVMDTTYLENAMIRAAEIALYADTETSPNGKSASQYLVGTTNGGQLAAYDVQSLDALLNDFKQDSQSNTYLLNSAYQSVGVGVVFIYNHKYLCVLVSNKTASPVASSVLQQSSVLVDQEVQTLPGYLTEMTSDHSNGYSVYCGGSLAAYVRVTNKLYPTATVVLTSYGAQVSFSKSGIFTYKDGYVYAVSPGTVTMTVTFSGVGKSVSCELTAVGKSFGDCTFEGIPDQIYTGSAITPKPTIRDANNTVLVSGTDYTVSYSNNVNVGTATVKITGKGLYKDQTKTLYFNIVLGGSDPSDSLSINLSATAGNLSLGESVTVKVVPVGGNTPITYTYDYAVYGVNQWTTIKSNTTATSCTFTPKAANTYLVRVTAVDSKGLTARQSLMVVVNASLAVKGTFTPAAPVVGGNVTVKISSTGGVSPVQYAIYYQKPSSSQWIALSEYSSTTTVSFKPAKEGTYELCFKAKDANNTIAKQYVPLKVTASTLTNRSYVSATNVDLGVSITMKGVGSGGATPYTYAFYYKKASQESWHTLKDYSTTEKVTFKPGAQTTYNLCIKVKDATDRVEKRYIDLTVNPRLVNNASASASSVTLGKTITIKGAASGGKGSYQYSYWYRLSGSSAFAKLKDFSTATSVSFTPKAVGRCYFRIKVKDDTGHIVSKDIFVDITSTLANKSTVSATSVTAGKSVTIKCSATGGSGTYQYAVYFQKPSASAYALSSDYATTTSRSVKLSAKGTYRLLVKVKDGNGTIVKKEFTVQST